jgi:hypothetical protein
VRGRIYTEDTATRKQTSLRTRDEIEAKSLLLNARNEAQWQDNAVLHGGEWVGWKFYWS